MKSTHLVFENGVHIANQLAKTAERACQLYASKTGKNWRDLTAVDYVSATANQIEAARKQSIKTDWRLLAGQTFSDDQTDGVLLSALNPITEEQPHARL
jgi:hypothetical protein